MKRRTFLAFLLALPLTMRDRAPVLYGDGIHDDTAALQALVGGKMVRYWDGVFAEYRALRPGIYKVTPLEVS